MKIQNSKGFTLIELMVAIFILTAGIVAVLSAFPLGVRIGKSAEMTTVATQLGQAKMEEIISKSYGDISSGTTTEDYGEISDFPSYKRITQVSYYDPVNSTTTESDLRIKKIKVTVSWELLLGAYKPSIDVINLIAEQ